MKIVNLTPHAITFMRANEEENLVINPSGKVARVSNETRQINTIDGIPVMQNVYGEIVDLPDPQEGVIYLVSSIVAARCSERNDVFIPNDSVRDDQGRIIGCRSLARV